MLSWAFQRPAGTAAAEMAAAVKRRAETTAAAAKRRAETSAGERAVATVMIVEM